MSINLADYDNRGYRAGAGLLKRILWYLMNATVLHSWLTPSSRIKVAILRVFGAKLGKGVIIKPRVNIKYPWYLIIGDNTWIGEGVWIDNLTWVRIGSNVCISQEAYLLTGNHNYKDKKFGLIIGEINIEDGVWIGARSVVCPGVHCGKQSILTVGSILQKGTVVNGVYRGNPAELIRERGIEDNV
jgi:putative colanic acid biosynthesis acetyltransferase WcaF